MTPDELIKQVDKDAAELERAHKQLVKEADMAAKKRRENITHLRNVQMRAQRIRAKLLTSNLDKSAETRLARLQAIREQVAESSRKAERLKTLADATTPRRKKKPRVRRGVFDDL